MTLAEGDLPTALAVLQLATLALLVMVIRRLGRLRRRAEDAEDLGDATALLVEDGRVVATSAEARRRLGECIGEPVGAVLERLLGRGEPAAEAALDRLMRSGEPIALIVQDAEGRRLELTGRPRGDRLVVALRTVDHLLADQPATPDALPPSPAAQVLEGLLGSAGAIAWRRDGAGRVTWAAGTIATPQGTVEAREAAEMAALRAARETAEAGDVQGNGAPGARRLRLELKGDGATGPVALDAIEAPDGAGGWTGLALDASEHLGAERMLARFVRTMTETFAQLKVGLAIFDHNQSLVLFNPALVEMWQADPAWLARRPSLREVLDSLRSSRRLPEVADFHAWRRRLVALFEDPETADYEELWHLADGSDIRVIARPHPQGSLAFVFDDVTEHLRLEQRYRHEVDIRRATLDRLDEGLAVFGPDGRLDFVNAAFHRIWGTEPESVRPGVHARELMPLVSGLAVETELWPRLLAFVAGEEARDAWGTRLVLGSGRILDARFAALPDGATMAVFTDITDSERIGLALEERNAALEAAEEIRSAVLDRISYSLRTPLNTIFGFSQLLVDPHFGALSDVQRGYAEQILESARSLLAAVDEVTGLAALDAGSAGATEAEPAPGVAGALLFVGRLLEKRATASGARLELDPPAEPVDAACPPETLRQILFRMGADALGRAPLGGEVRLGARRAADRRLELYARAPLPPDAPPVAEIRAREPQLSLLRRLVGRARGELRIDTLAGESMLEIVCGLPAEGAREEEAAGARAATAQAEHAALGDGADGA